MWRFTRYVVIGDVMSHFELWTIIGKVVAQSRSGD
jgi:hypothetical protein